MDDFINNVINTWGESGAIWLDNLANIIEQLSVKWELTDILACPNLSYGFVAEANKNNKPVILKITHDSIKQEYLTLKYNNGRGMVSIIDVDNDLNALLLEKICPGISLNTRKDLSILDKIAIYAGVVNNIASISLHDSQNYPHILSWCDVLINMQNQEISKKLSDKAAVLVEYLLKTLKNEYLCHGDLHLDNILQHDRLLSKLTAESKMQGDSERRTGVYGAVHEDSSTESTQQFASAIEFQKKSNGDWLAIDPKGIIAEKEFEVAAFNLLTDVEIDKKVNISKKIMVRNHSLATQFGFIPQRLLAWIYIRSMLMANWHLEDNGDPTKSIFIAEQIYPLLKLDY